MTPEESTKQRILQIAKKLFTKKSYSGVSIADIITEFNKGLDKEEQIGKSVLFYHFHTKLELAHKVLESIFGDFEIKLLNEVEKTDDPIKKLEIIVDSMMEFALHHPNLTHFGMEIINEDNRLETKKVDWISEMMKYSIHVGKILNDMGVPNVATRTMILFSALDGIAVYGGMIEQMMSKKDIDRFKKELVHIITQKPNQKEEKWAEPLK